MKARRVEADASLPPYHANGLRRFCMIVLAFPGRYRPMKLARAAQST